MPKCAIVGCGVVGSAMDELIDDAVLYDIRPEFPNDKDAVNTCDIAFVCVPTPMSEDGTCDYSAVEEAVQWIECELIVVRSTIPPGTTDALSAKYSKRIVFQPEYLGETKSHPFTDMSARSFVVLGGTDDDTAAVADIYATMYHSSVKFYFCDAKTAELTKYMENCFYATKVIFCCEFMKIAQAIGVKYPQLREMWLADTRISPDHTFAYPDNPGFSGKCLPKDLSAIIKSAEDNGYDPTFLKSVWDVNKQMRGE